VTGRVAGPDVRAQTRQTLLNLEAVLVSAGSSLDRVDKCTVFLTRAEDFPAMNDVYRQFFSTQPPARSTVIVAGLARPDLVVEIECIAHI
jgi:2-iminobutanoate/2-iminopropanoate deaminase